jgi:hypothetical protein
MECEMERRFHRGFTPAEKTEIAETSRMTYNGHRSFHDRWSLLLLLSASPVDLFAVIAPGWAAASGYSVPAWDKLGALSRIRSSPNKGRGRP